VRPRIVDFPVVTPKIQTGDATKLYNATLNHLQRSSWNDTRNAKTLAWMVTGLIQTGSSTPPNWIPSVQTQATRAQSTERRFSRWLTNKHITAQHVYTPLITQALQNWGEYEFRLALDTSLIFETHCIIRIVVLYRGRAVPLVQTVIAHASATVSFEQLEEVLNTARAILRRLKRCKVIFLADRGFADISLMQRLKDFGWSYRIRIKASFGIYSPDKQLLCKIGQVALEAGQAKYYQNVRLTAQHFGLVHVALARPEGMNELWAVVSDEPTSEQTFVEYGWRFEIEEYFLDDKSGAFNLEDSGLRDAESLERLLLVLGVTMLLLVSEGTQVVTNGLRCTVDAHWSRGLSYLKIGWRWVRRAVAVGTAIFERIALVGGVDPEPLGFRKRSGVTAAKAIAGLRGRTFAFQVSS
jgi:Transposase DDE domain